MTSSERKVANNEQKLTSSNHKVTRNEEKITSNKENVTSNKQQTKSLTSPKNKFDFEKLDISIINWYPWGLKNKVEPVI